LSAKPDRCLTGVNSSGSSNAPGDASTALAEHKAVFPEGYQYSAFCQHYRAWATQVDLVMRQTPAPGRRCSSIMPANRADYGAHTAVSATLPSFLSLMLGASNTLCRSDLDPDLAGLDGSHYAPLLLVGPELLVPDN